MLTVYHSLMLTRAQVHDFSFTYEFAHLSFAMAKPAQEPQWQGLYYPLSHRVWVALAAALLVIPLIYSAVNISEYHEKDHSYLLCSPKYLNPERLFSITSVGVTLRLMVTSMY